MAGLMLGMRPISMLLAIVLVRLLAPADFGLLALAMIIFNTSNLVTDMGMSPAIVQTKHDIEKVAHYAFVLIMLTSVTVTGLIIYFAPPLARFLGGGADLVPVLRWMSIYVIVDGLWTVPEALLKRELKFKQLGLSQIPAELAYLFIAIPLAMAGFGVWSLVIGHVLGQVLRTMLLWAYHRPWIWLRPQKWDPVVVKSLLRFGTPTMAGGALRFVQSQTDTWLVGRNFSTTFVGFYDKAYTLTGRMAKMLTNTIFGNVLFPSYSKMQGDRERLKRAYLKSTKMVLLMMVPVSIGLAATAPLLVPVLLGQQWAPMIPVWQIFSIFGLTWAVSANSSPIFLALGQPTRNITASTVYLIVMIPAALLLMGPYGISGVAIAVSLGHVVTVLFNIFQVNQVLPGTARGTFINSLPFVAVGGVMGVSIYLLQPLIVEALGGPSAISLVVVILVAALIYGAMTLLLQRALVVEIVELFIKVVGIDRRWPKLVPARLRTTK